MIAICASGSRRPGGIFKSAFCSIACTSRLSAGAPAFTAGPRLPPWRISARLSIERPLLRFFWVWHGEQLVRSSGAPSGTAAVVWAAAVQAQYTAQIDVKTGEIRADLIL